MGLYAAEGECQGFNLGDDDDGGHSSDSSLDLHTFGMSKFPFHLSASLRLC